MLGSHTLGVGRYDVCLIGLADNCWLSNIWPGSTSSSGSLCQWSPGRSKPRGCRGSSCRAAMEKRIKTIITFSTCYWYRRSYARNAQSCRVYLTASADLLSSK